MPTPTLTPEQLSAYQMRPGESGDAYKTRVDEFNAATPDGPGAAIGDDPFFKEIQTRLLKTSGGTSSVNPVSSAIEEAISGLSKGLEAGQKGIKAKYEQQRLRDQYDFGRDLTGAREGMNNLGAASQLAVLEQYRESNSRRMKDLDLAEQQALATGQYETYSKIADLKVRAAESQFDFEQKTFSNMFQAAGLYLQKQQEARMADSEQYSRTADISKIALEYGLKVTPGETLESIISKASPLASERQKLELAQIRASIAASNRSGTQQSAGERLNSSLGRAISSLEATRGKRTAAGGDTYYNPKTYEAARQDFIKSGGTREDFDTEFGYNINPNDRGTLGIGSGDDDVDSLLNALSTAPTG